MKLWEARAQIDLGSTQDLDDFLVEREETDWLLIQNIDAGRVYLTGVFATEAEARTQWAALREGLPAKLDPLKVEVRQIEEREWQEAYKEHFTAWHFDRLHWAPIWQRGQYQPPEGEDVVWLDPGMAFGTGNHETTRLCVERMIAFRRDCEAAGRSLADLSVIDCGCGSGILAISAAKRGFAKVIGFDIDPVAVDISRQNAALNDLADRVIFFQADLVTGLRNVKADLVMANIQADILRRHVDELSEAVADGGRLALSGILAREIGEVRDCFTVALPEARISSHELGEWADIEFALPKNSSH